MIDEYINERLKKIEKLKELNINPYPQIIIKNKKSSEQLLKKYEKISHEKSNKLEEFAGRMIGFRSMGKISFSHLQDEFGKMQIVFQKKETKNYDLLKLTDIGDILFVKGYFFKTKKGEISILAKEFIIASKSIRPLPEKFHGINDDELRLRKRELDAIMNREVIEKFKKKSFIVKSLREFLDNNGFLEVQTPVLQTTYGGASAEPFITHHNALDLNLYLRIAPEIYLKRMITAGFEKIYELGNKYRNEGMDKSHLQEILDIEFYWAYQDYENLMKFTEELISYVLKKVNGSLKINYQGQIIDFTPPYKRITFRELLIKNTGIDIDKFNNFKLLKKEIVKKKIKDVDINSPKHYGALLDELYKRTARQKIIQPTFMTDYPVEMIPLAKRKENNPSKISSFQLLVNSWELIKAYDELNDPVDQRKRFVEQQKFIELGDREAHPLDEDFIESMELGMPPIAGWGMGLARFCMLLMDEPNIRESVFFPLMKPENKK